MRTRGVWVRQTRRGRSWALVQRADRPGHVRVECVDPAVNATTGDEPTVRARLRRRGYSYVARVRGED